LKNVLHSLGWFDIKDGTCLRCARGWHASCLTNGRDVQYT